MTKTETVEITRPIPPLPDQIPEADFNRFEVITQANIDQLLRDVENGNREPLNGVYLPYIDYLTLASWMAHIERYIKQAEAHFKAEQED